jgi:hypothetical protein
MSMRLETEIDLLQIKDGDTVLLHYNPEVHPDGADRAGNRLRAYLKSIAIDAVVLVMPFGMDLDVMDEDDMRLYGWVRPERRKQRAKPKASKKKPEDIPGPTTPGLD